MHQCINADTRTRTRTHTNTHFHGFGNWTIACQCDMVDGMVVVGRILPCHLHSTARVCIRSRVRPVHVFELLAQPGAPILAQNRRHVHGLRWAVLSNHTSIQHARFALSPRVF